jgi:hypothetical protein
MGGRAASVRSAVASFRHTLHNREMCKYMVATLIYSDASATLFSVYIVFARLPPATSFASDPLQGPLAPKPPSPLTCATAALLALARHGGRLHPCTWLHLWGRKEGVW